MASIDVFRTSNTSPPQDSNAIALSAHQQPSLTTWATLGAQLHLDKNLDGMIPTSASISPTTSRLSEKDMKIFGGEPLSQELILVKCNKCQKTLISSSFKDHAARCKNTPEFKSRHQQPISSNFNNQHRSNSNHLSDHFKDLYRRRKNSFGPDNHGERGAAATPHIAHESIDMYTNYSKSFYTNLRRSKIAIGGNIDLETQCGVLINGTSCPRQLTCKSHTMDDKRRVVGRSQSLYNLLCASHGEKHTIRSFPEDPIPPTSIDAVGVQETRMDADADLEAVLKVIKLANAATPPDHALPDYKSVKQRTTHFRIKHVLMAAINRDHLVHATISPFTASDPSVHPTIPASVQIFKGPLSTAFASPSMPNATKPTKNLQPTFSRSNSAPKKNAVSNSARNSHSDTKVLARGHGNAILHLKPAHKRKNSTSSIDSHESAKLFRQNGHDAVNSEPKTVDPRDLKFM